MNKDRAKEMIAVMQAWVNGKEVECRPWPSSNWLTTPAPAFDFEKCEYRVKPEPTWRAWNEGEIPKRFMLRHKVTGHVHVGYRVEFPWVAEHAANAFPIVHTTSTKYLGVKDLLNDWLHIHEDGTESPCGVLVSQ